MIVLSRAAQANLHAAVRRGLMFLALWLALSLGNLADLAAGLIAATAAALTSLHLLPPSESGLSLAGAATLALRFLRQSILGGVDVASRALDPLLPLHLGFVSYPTRLKEGVEQCGFCTIASLLPGTLPVGAQGSGCLLIHCLDTDQPVIEELSKDEVLFKRAFGGGTNG